MTTIATASGPVEGLLSKDVVDLLGITYRQLNHAAPDEYRTGSGYVRIWDLSTVRRLSVAVALTNVVPWAANRHSPWPPLVRIVMAGPEPPRSGTWFVTVSPDRDINYRIRRVYSQLAGQLVGLSAIWTAPEIRT